jgi:Helix-turn-helix domain
MAWMADDFAAWLVGLLADRGRRSLADLSLDDELRRALGAAATAAVPAAAAELAPGDEDRAANLARVISEAFAVAVPIPAAADATVLEVWQAQISAQVAVLEDTGLTDVPGLIASALTRRLLAEILQRAALGGPLQELAAQLNADLAHLQVRRVQGMTDPQGKQDDTLLGRTRDEFLAAVKAADGKEGTDAAPSPSSGSGDRPFQQRASILKKSTRVTGADRARLAKELAARYSAGESIRFLAASTGRSYGFIYRILSENGTTLRGRGGAARRIRSRQGSGETRRAGSAGSEHEIPVRIYLDNAAAGPAAEDALRGLLGELGVEEIRELRLVIASWYRSLAGLLKQAGDSDAAAEARRAVELHALDRFQAGIDGVTGDAVARLITALGDTKGAVIQVGSIIMVKVGEILIVRQLSSREMAHWQGNPGLFQNPADALAELQRGLDAQPPGTASPPGIRPETRSA